MCLMKIDYDFKILGGLGGFGLELTDWLAIRGARKIVLTSRTGLRTGYQALRIRLWRSYGAEVVISTQDITTEEGVINLMKEANAMGPIDGIFNLAVVSFRLTNFCRLFLMISLIACHSIYRCLRTPFSKTKRKKILESRSDRKQWPQNC